MTFALRVPGIERGRRGAENLPPLDQSGAEQLGLGAVATLGRLSSGAASVPSSPPREATLRPLTVAEKEVLGIGKTHLPDICSSFLLWEIIIYLFSY